MAKARELLFAYGSLVARGGRPARLLGHARRFGVAMDNAVDLPGYKHYLRRDGTRPAVHVAFLDVAPEPGAHVTGVLLDVEPAELPAIDARERNYRREDVTHAVPGAPGRVWCYRGTPDARRRLFHARGRESAVVHRGYAAAVEGAFATLGGRALAAYRATTEPSGLALADLVRVDAR